MATIHADSTKVQQPAVAVLPQRKYLPARYRRLMTTVAITLFGILIILFYLGPLGYMASTGLKSDAQISDPKVPRWLPLSRATFEYEGETYDILAVPMPDGTIRDLALVKPGRQQSEFIDPADPAAGTIVWDGQWRTLEPDFSLDLKWENFKRAWVTVDFPRLYRNTLVIAISGTLGTLISSTLVAYGFARFRFPAKKTLFLILISTIILPAQATLIPTFLLFSRLGWTGTWLPLIVPHLFSNAFNVFLLRQYFMSIPRELDEAAAMDGATPPQILWHVILPQSIPALSTVALFHFFFAWNDFLQPLIYLSSRPDLQPIAVGLQAFNSLYSREVNTIQAAAVIAMIVPVVVFFLAQRVFVRGIVFTGVEK
jgi:multiple sugar transport system permease protein